jgi:hypothetical protein
MEWKQAVEFAHDIQTGLGTVDVPDFLSLRTIGMSTTLALHFRGLGEINYEVLRKVSEHFFGIPSYALPDALELLQEISYVRIVGKRPAYKSVIPDVPHFSDIYDGIGEFASALSFNEHEQATLHILGELQLKPENKDRLLSTSGMDKGLFTRCVAIGESGNYLKNFRARGKDILASPVYFADNLNGLVDLSAKAGSDDIGKVIISKVIIKGVRAL